MGLIVQKFGGTSVADATKIQRAARRAIRTKLDGHQVVMVVSAMGKTTDELIELAREVSPNPPRREMDMLMTTGEQVSIALMAMAIDAAGHEAISFTGGQVGLITDAAHRRARIQQIDADRIRQHLAAGKIVIVAGFQGINAEGLIQTLGRGGSDLSAIALASAVGADLCQILTDVDGVYTADPRVVPEARKLPEVSYDELLELASLGTKVMQSRSVEFAKKFGVVFEVRSSLNTNPGTIVTEEHQAMEAVVIRGVSIERSQARVTITGIPDEPGMSATILGALAEAEINIDMIVSNIAHDGYARHSFTMHTNDLGRAQAALKSVLANLGPEAAIETEAGIAKLSVVGIGMRSHSGIAAQLFKALGDAGINIGMISTSEIKISVTVDETRIEDAARVAHRAFELDTPPLPPCPPGSDSSRSAAPRT